MENIFKKAGKLKLRFDYKGNLSVEDLWDLSVEELDQIYKALKSYEKESKSVTLLGEKKRKSVSDIGNELGIEIVTEIVEDKIKQAEENQNRLEKKKTKQRLLELVADKQDEELKGKSLEELNKMIEEL